MSTVHQRRVAEHIRTVLSELFLREIRDPRLQGVTVTEVAVDREIQYAEIYVHAQGEEELEEEVMSALGQAGGYLRRELAGALRGRTVPELRFHWDPSFAYADRIDELLGGLEIPDESHDDDAMPSEGQV